MSIKTQVSTSTKTSRYLVVPAVLGIAVVVSLVTGTYTLLSWNPQPVESVPVQEVTAVQPTIAPVPTDAVFILPSGNLNFNEGSVQVTIDALDPEVVEVVTLFSGFNLSALQQEEEIQQVSLELVSAWMGEYPSPEDNKMHLISAGERLYQLSTEHEFAKLTWSEAITTFRVSADINAVTPQTGFLAKNSLMALYVLHALPVEELQQRLTDVDTKIAQMILYEEVTSAVPTPHPIPSPSTNGTGNAVDVVAQTDSVASLPQISKPTLPIPLSMDLDHSGGTIGFSYAPLVWTVHSIFSGVQDPRSQDLYYVAGITDVTSFSIPFMPKAVSGVSIREVVFSSCADVTFPVPNGPVFTFESTGSDDWVRYKVSMEQVPYWYGMASCPSKNNEDVYWWRSVTVMPKVFESYFPRVGDVSFDLHTVYFSNDN